MRYDEFTRIIKGLKSVYTKPDYIPDRDAINMWYELLKDIEYNELSLATKVYMQTKAFPPTPADLRKIVVSLRSDNAETDVELWAKIAKAARNSTYGSVEEFEKLPPVCKAFIGSAASLKELGLLDKSTLETVVKGQFMRVAPQIRERKNEVMGLSAEIRQEIERAKLLQLGE
ncbi:MAG: hypothetical protein K6B42_03160 [Clostridia bacterium]|nr:hypothetical protein [Clostridia bacterium]